MSDAVTNSPKHSATSSEGVQEAVAESHIEPTRRYHVRVGQGASSSSGSQSSPVSSRID